MRLLIFILLLLTPYLLIAQSPDSPSFASAEERIVYNKQQNLPRYSGVQIQYSCMLAPDVKKDKQPEIEELIRTYFEEIVEIRYEDGMRVFVLTEGNISNHEQHRKLLNDAPHYFTKGSRTYFLKD